MQKKYIREELNLKIKAVKYNSEDKTFYVL